MNYLKMKACAASWCWKGMCFLTTQTTCLLNILVSLNKYVSALQKYENDFNEKAVTLVQWYPKMYQFSLNN